MSDIFSLATEPNHSQSQSSKITYRHAINNMADTAPSKRRMRSRSKGRHDDDGIPLTEVSKKGRPIDEILKEAVQESSLTHDRKPNKGRKKKESNDTLLDKLRKGEGIVKDEVDTALLANTYDPDTNKSGKTNKKRQKENLQLRKGVSNTAYEEENENERTVRKNSKNRNDRDSTVIEMEPTVKVRTGKKQVITETPQTKRRNSTARRHRDGTEERTIKHKGKKSATPDLGSAAEQSAASPTEDEDVQTTAKSRVKKKKKPGKSEIEEYTSDHLEGQTDEMLTPDPDAEDDTKRKHRKKKKRRRKEVVEDEDHEAAAATEDDLEVDPEEESRQKRLQILDDGRIAGVTVHRTDKLKTDFHVLHPVVRVSVVDLQTGMCLTKQNKDRPVSSYYETDNENIDFIVPIMTKPYDFKEQRSTLPVWEELLVFNENFNFLIQDDPEVIVFFELMDFISVRSAMKNNAPTSGGGWHHIAWAFLKLRGANNVLNTDHKVRLQLYCPPVRYRTKGNQLQVYKWWKSTDGKMTRYQSRVRYPSTMYVTVKGIQPPQDVEAATRSMFPIQAERGTLSFDQLQKNLEAGTLGKTTTQQNSTIWSRQRGQACRVPNQLMVGVRAGRSGCFVVKFSHNGKKLACAGHDKDSYSIYIYEIPSGTYKTHILSHYSLIYDLCWSNDNTHLLSASSDGTARVWDMQTYSSQPVKMLPHPTFVYAARYHPMVDKIMVTGCYDRIIRVWSNDTEDVHAQLLQEIDGHMSYVNCVCFDILDGNLMYSADGLGVIKVWNVYVTKQQSKKGTTREWTFNSDIKDEELKGVVINHMIMHPNGRRIIVHSRDNKIRMFDLKSKSVMQRYHGSVCMSQRVRCTISPCGSFLVAGSEDNCAYVWNVETGDKVVAFYSLGYTAPVVDIDFHPHDHILALCAFANNHHVVVYKYSADASRREAGIEAEPTVRPVSTMGRPGSPEKLSRMDFADEDGVERSRSVAMSIRDDLLSHQLSHMERTNKKLQAVSMSRASGAMSRQSVATPQFGNTYGLDTFLGSTFDSNYPNTMGAFASLTRHKNSPEPSLFSPHASHTMESTIQRQAYQSQTDYLKRSATPGWRPGFSAAGEFGATRSGSPTGYMMSPHMSMSSNQGKPEFRFQGSARQSNLMEMVVAAYDYQGQRAVDLSFVRGDMIQVLYKDNDNWWLGQLANGQEGYFPSNYVSSVDDGGVRKSTEFSDYDDPAKEVSLSEYTKNTLSEESDSEIGTTTAVVSKSGELKFLTVEDGEIDKQQKIVRKSKARSSRSKLKIENEQLSASTGTGKKGTGPILMRTGDSPKKPIRKKHLRQSFADESEA